MSILALFVRSLLLTTVFSFAAPILLIGGIGACLYTIGYLPGMAAISQAGAEQIWSFLATFGSGQPIQGLVAIGLTCSLVGALFDAYVFYWEQIMHGN